MTNNNDIHIRNKILIDNLIENIKLSEIIEQIILEENRLKRILGPFRNILPKLIISEQEFKKRVDEYIKTKLNVSI